MFGAPRRIARRRPRSSKRLAEPRKALLAQPVMLRRIPLTPNGLARLPNCPRAIRIRRD